MKDIVRFSPLPLRLVHTTACLAMVLTIAVGAVIAHQGHGPITLDDLTRNALAIVEGRVDSVKSAWNPDHTQIRTTVRVLADAFYKGDNEASAVEFVLLGGAVGEDGLAIIGQPEFRTGEHVIVFLRASWKTSDVPVVQMEHGKFTVETNAAGAEVLVNSVGARYAKGEALASIRLMNAALTGGRP